MALTQSYIAHNVIGNKREDYIQATFTGVTSGIITTRMKVVDAIDFENVTAPGGTLDASDNAIIMYPNAHTAVTTDPFPGDFFVNGVTAEQVYIFRVIGR